MTYFAKDQVLRFTEYDVSAPATFGPATVDTAGAGTIVLTADPFLGAFPATGVYCHWANYDECIASQKAWLFMGDTAYSLGAAGDACYVWAA